MSVKLLAVGIGVAAMIGAAGVATAEPAPAPAIDQPLDPAAAALPAPAQLTGILDDLVDPQVPDEVKSRLVAGGLQHHQTAVLDHRLREMGRRGGLPVTFTATDITAAGPNTVTSVVTAVAPKLPSPITRTVTFTNENGWLVSQDGADELIEEIVGRLPN